MTTILYSAGDTSLRSVSTDVGDRSENLESNLGSSGQQGLEINELGGDGLSGSASVEDELKGFASDASSSGILSVSFLRRIPLSIIPVFALWKVSSLSITL